MNLGRIPADHEEELNHLLPRAAEQPDHSINDTPKSPNEAALYSSGESGRRVSPLTMLISSA
jgi:hypothetical protein